jgi:hypothetical protein
MSEPISEEPIFEELSEEYEYHNPSLEPERFQYVDKNNQIQWLTAVEIELLEIEEESTL